MRRVLVVGLGLIGGSLAKNIKYNQENECKVYGFDNLKSTLDYAVKYQLIDEKVDTFQQGVAVADIIILATPIHITINYLEQLNKTTMDRKKIVTDVSSVKGSIMEVAEQLTNPNVSFVGGHPMAGSHKQGIEAAKSHLFENAYYVLTPSIRATEEDVQTIQHILEGTKSNFVILSGAEHDKMTGIVSHFPHLVASSLVHQAINWQSEYPFIPKLAAGGFRDITRIASSNPELWQDIFFQNKEEMLIFLTDWIEEMKKVQGLLETERKEEVIAYLKQAKAYRDGLPKKKKGAIPSFYDLYVDIYDKPGELYKVIKLLAEFEINITNIQILEIRENMTGVLRITVQSEEGQLTAKSILENNGYEVSVEE
ncbi:prephenate dehydrogenase [Salirhabdus euzebyi]|uniref:Prephenate dehydrogenase n=1 Tax=Salirhabdus euzebyi TaxID=394506 RepID=A0A841PYR4_9BACI|nr:prephenate dehydrogenase [Salirhabdus euzebyi]MBB6452211.1 prephenate dehydrogenase [Salirhabdus euzebyi]